MKLRHAKTLTEERNRKNDTKKHQDHKKGMQEAIKAIEDAHTKDRNQCSTTGLPDTVIAELKRNGYRATRVKPDDFVGPGYLGEVHIEWD